MSKDCEYGRDSSESDRGKRNFVGLVLVIVGSMEGGGLDMSVRDRGKRYCVGLVLVICGSSGGERALRGTERNGYCVGMTLVIGGNRRGGDVRL